MIDHPTSDQAPQPLCTGPEGHARRGVRKDGYLITIPEHPTVLAAGMIASIGTPCIRRFIPFDAHLHTLMLSCTAHPGPYIAISRLKRTGIRILEEHSPCGHLRAAWRSSFPDLEKQLAGRPPTDVDAHIAEMEGAYRQLKRENPTSKSEHLDVLRRIAPPNTSLEDLKLLRKASRARLRSAKKPSWEKLRPQWDTTE